MAGSIFVTGASSGIGQAVAETFLDAGWTVGLFARRADRLDAVARGRAAAHVLPGDVSDAEAVERAINRFADAAGRLDVLFNNAGIFTPAAPIDEIPLGDWKQAVDVNLNGMFYAARAAFARMRAQNPQGGRIINNGSISAHAPRDGSITYTTTKHAITGMPVRHRLRPDRHRQRPHRPLAEPDRQGRGGRRRAAAVDGCRPCRRGGAEHGPLAAGRECFVHDGDGDEDALRRTRLTAWPVGSSY
jgi:NADP-dependent 3-hydroxy acid dehydrogenase YdfG